MLSGVHAPNKRIDAADLYVVCTGKFGAVKLLWSDHTPSDVSTLQEFGVRHFVLRLPDSYYKDKGRYAGAQEYADDCARLIERFLGVGVTTFQVDNEPNWQWQHLPYGPWQYQNFMRDMLPRLLERIPPHVRLVSPPLSWSPALWHLDATRQINPTDFILDQWLEAYAWHGDHGQLPNLWQLFDEAGVNIYFESYGQMLDPSYGTAYAQVHEQSGYMDIGAMEWGCSFTHHKPTAPTLQEVEARMVLLYPAWLDQAATAGYVTEAYAYLVGGTDEWRGFRVTEKVARAMLLAAKEMP